MTGRPLRPAILALDEAQQRALLGELADILQDMIFARGPEVDLGGDAVLAAAARAFSALGVLETDERVMWLTVSRGEIARRIAEAPIQTMPLPVDVLAVALHVAPPEPAPSGRGGGQGVWFGLGLDAVLDALGLVDGQGRPAPALQAILIDLRRLTEVGGAWPEEIVVLIGEMARDLAASAPHDVPQAPGGDPAQIRRLTEAIRTRSRCGHWLRADEIARPGAGRPWGVLPQLLVRALRGLPL